VTRANVFETGWTTNREVEAMDNSYRLLDLTGDGKVGRLTAPMAKMAGRQTPLPNQWEAHGPVGLA
jgi:hypothetical protein